MVTGCGHLDKLRDLAVRQATPDRASRHADRDQRALALPGRLDQARAEFGGCGRILLHTVHAKPCSCALVFPPVVVRGRVDEETSRPSTTRIGGANQPDGGIGAGCDQQFFRTDSKVFGQPDGGIQVARIVHQVGSARSGRNFSATAPVAG